MKKVLFLLPLTAFFYCLQAQSFNEGLMHYETVGRDLLKQTDIIAFKTSFETTIHSASFDSVTNTALVTLWNRDGESQNRSYTDFNCTVVYYDLENHEAKWQREINLKDGRYWKKGPFVFREFGKGLSLIDEESGKEKYKIGESVHLVSYDVDEGWIMFANERYFSRGTRDLRCVDLATKKENWHWDLVSSQDLDATGTLNDSVLLIVGEGLHAVDVHNGSGWHVKLVTEVADQIGMRVSYPMKVYSNPLIDSAFIYMAGAKEIVKLDHFGKEIWREGLPYSKMSHSSLGVYKDYLVLINQGIAPACPYPYQSFLMVWGNPFFAAFDINTGKMLYTHERSKNADYILSGINKENAIYLIFADREGHQSIEKYMISTGELMAKKTIAPMIVESSGGLNGFVGPQVYIRRDSSFIKLKEVDTLGIYVFCENGVLQFDNELKSVGYFSFNDLYVYRGKHNDYCFYSHEGKTIVVDANEREVATLDFPEVFCAASEIYSIKDKTLYVIKKEQLFE